MSTPLKSTPTYNGMKASSTFTETGLPFHCTHFGVPNTASDLGDGGPSRRVDCRSPQLISVPSIQPPNSKILFSKARVDISLEEPSLNTSLIDDDDDELVDYFSSSSACVGPVSSPPITDVVQLSSSHWNVRERDVPSVPSFYPLEKSSVFIPQAWAPVLASRIASVLRARSIAASFDGPNAKVDCVSKSRVEFRIRLYRGRGEYDHGIIVEVQRREGFVLSYSQDVQAILDAAEGRNVKDNEWGNTPIYYEESDSSVSSDDEDMDSLENTAGLTSLKVISEILCPQDGKADEVVMEGRDFALASLASLTSLDRMGQAAVHFSNELLNSEMHAGLRTVVFSNVGSDSSSQIPQRPMLQSLEILANVATSVPNKTSFVGVLSHNDHDILRKLIVNIENFSRSPRAADLSCLVFKNILRSQEMSNIGYVLPPRYKERLMSAMMKAVSFGGEFYAELEMHAQQCLELMQQ